MNAENIISLLKFVNDKKSVTIIRRTISTFLCFVIASSLFEKLYFKYTIYDISDYKSIFNFLVKGQFMVPLLIFLLIWLTTKYIPVFYNEWRKRRFQEKFDKGTENVKRGLETWFEDVPSLKRILGRNMKLTPGDVQGFKMEIYKRQNILEEYLVLIIRIFIVLLISFVSTAYFGWMLFCLSILAIMISLVLLLSLDAFLEILPDLADILVQKINIEKPSEGLDKLQ